MWFAFNQMQRLKGNYKPSLLYSISRKYQAEQISILNKGKKRTQKQKERMSNQAKGTCVVKDKAGNKFRTSVNDPRLLTGEIQHEQVGRKHSSATKEKMSKNGIKGKFAFHDKDDKICYLDSYEEGIQLGLAAGLPDYLGKKVAENMKKRKWYTKADGTYVRLPPAEAELDSTLRCGRIGFQGWKIINDKRSDSVI